MNNDDKCESIVKRHVLAPATVLVSKLATMEEFMDDILEVTGQDDWETPARDAGFTVEQQPDGYWLTWLEDGEQILDGPYSTARDAWESCCQDNNIEPEYDEAYEFWIVSDVMAHHLEKRGELVTTDFLGLIIWGRCASGQPIYKDAVMQDIAAQTAI